MPSCSVFTCKKNTKTFNAQNSNVSFHLFPKDEFTKHKWTLACANLFGWTPARTSRVCSEHFDDSCFVVMANSFRRLKEGAVPTLKLPKGQPSIVSKTSYCKIVYNENSLHTKPENQRSISSTAAHLDKPCKVSEQGTSASKSTYKAPFLDLAKITKLENQTLIIPDPVDPCEVSKPETSLNSSTFETRSLDIASITKLEKKCLTTPPTAQLVKSWESETSASLSTYNLQSQEGKDMDLKNCLKMKDLKIKRLQKQNRYFKTKITELRELLKGIKKDKEKDDRLLICKVCVKVDNWCGNKNRKNKQSKEDEE